MDFIPTYPDATQWSNTHHMEIQTVNPTTNIDATNDLHSPITIVVQKTHFFDVNLHKRLILQHERSSKIKSEEYAKFLTNKKALITIIFRQCDEAIKTKITLRVTYTADRRAGLLVKFPNRLRTVCFGSDNGGLSYGPHKQVISVKSINNYTNNEPHDPHSFKEQVKIKYETTKVIAGKFQNGTAALMELLSKAQPTALHWTAYCALSVDQQLVWEQRADELNQVMLFLMNSKNKIAKKDLRLACSQGNNTAYPPNIEEMARYLSIHYPNNKPTNQRRGKKEKKRRE